jgi:two-component system, sensor histidine kinase and response regulator
VIGPTAATNRKEDMSLSNNDMPARRSLSVLLVEDNLANRKIITLMLRKHGHRVTVAESGREALKRFMSGRFCAVLMDIEMPVMDGYLTAAAIRRKELASDARTPIIALTAHLPEGNRNRWTEAGMDAFLTKPIDVNQLISMVETIKHRESLNYGKAVVNRTARPIAEAEDCLSPAIDFTAIMRRLENDRDLFRDFAEIFDEEAPKLLEAILAAAACVDLTAIRRSAHALRGLAANFDAKELVETAGRLELASEYEISYDQATLPKILSSEVARVREALASYR